MRVVRGKVLLDPLERLLLHVKKVPGDLACWPWIGAKKPTGYGNFWLDGKSVGAHVASFILHGGIIPFGYEVHHKCNNTQCVRPQHLEAVTPSKNILESVNHWNRNKTHCIRGHEFNEGNTYYRQRGTTSMRQCRLCKRG